jgi:dienelactone hydrolase
MRMALAAQRGLIPLALLALAGAAVAQPAPSGVNADMAAQAAARNIENGRAPDSIGTGPFPARKGQYPGLPQGVVYQPADLSRLAGLKMPIYVFGNGACSEDGASQRQHLLEIASHGYLVIAPGGIYSGPGVTTTPESWAAHRDKTRYQQLGEAIDWAIAENSRKESPFYRRIDTAHVAASGYSCGGIQALKYAGDPRISTFVIMNSGILNGSSAGMGEMAADKGLLDKVDKPILYVLGGKNDIAYPNGMDDYARLTRVPAAVINIDVTHDGTYSDPNGGRAAQAVVAWLQWQLRGDRKAAAWFVGKDCRLCRDLNWQIQSRNLR